ncbi:MAG: glutamyl-tRNA reductase [Deltaproteobacteria bacterium]|nr:glutamyl-tRNA reductase [Deltaproteobacteria bacterium]
MRAELIVVGLSYRTAPLEIREKLSFPDEVIPHALNAICGLPSVGEAILVSTCNRVEIYAATRAGTSAAAVPAASGEIRRFLVDSRGEPADKLSAHLYERSGEAAVRHVFRVASSLDSLVIGESQILGQLKTAYGTSSQAGCVGPLLGRCLERAFGVAKRVRTETAIARGAANVSSVAVDLAQRIFGDLGDKRVLVIGAGKMSDLAARHLRAAGALEILVTNRSPERAEELARRVDGVARRFEELDKLLTAADIVISSTGSREPIVSVGLMRSIVKARRHRPIFLIDIAVPRDIDPLAAKLDGVYLYDVDDLQQVVADNLKERKKEAGSAERIIEAEVVEFMAWLRAQGVVPTIRDLREHFLNVARAEAEKTLLRIGTEVGQKEEKAIRQLAESIVNKLLHAPLMTLKEGEQEEAELMVAVTRRLFALSEHQGEERQAGPVAVTGEKP